MNGNDLNISFGRTGSFWMKIPDIGPYTAFAKVFGILVKLGNENKTVLLGRSKEMEQEMKGPTVKNADEIFLVHVFGNETIEFTDSDTFEISLKRGFLYKINDEKITKENNE